MSQSFQLPGLELSGIPVFLLDTIVVPTKANEEHFISDTPLITIFKDQQQRGKGNQMKGWANAAASPGGTFVNYKNTPLGR